MEDVEYFTARYNVEFKILNLDILEVLNKTGEKIEDLVIKTCTLEEFINERGKFRFTAWSENNIYVIKIYDNWNDVVVIPRHPTGEPVFKIGEG